MQQRHFSAASLINIRLAGSRPNGASSTRSNVWTKLLNLLGLVPDISERFYAMYIPSSLRSVLASECRILQINYKIGVSMI